MSPHELLERAPSSVQQGGRAADRPNQTVPFLTQAHICQRFGISDETWRRWRKSGRAPAPLPNFPVRRPRWSLSAIEDFEHGRLVVGPTTRRFFGSARRLQRVG